MMTNAHQRSPQKLPLRSFSQKPKQNFIYHSQAVSHPLLHVLGPTSKGMFSPLGVCQHPIYLGFWSLDLKLPLTCRSGTLYLNVNIASHLVVELVVRAEHHEAAPRDAEREEHLLGGFPPDREVQQLVELWHEEEVEAVGGAAQHAAADQKGDEDDVGKRGREVYDLKLVSVFC